MVLIDSAQRQLATSPSSSFIVQAPAGSGKTEILTQRFLRLLSTVSAPEQIVALTFTRKAASEMRERIIHALFKAATHQKAKSPHQQLTQDYATQALEQSRRHGWDLLEQPNRLKIMTIDSLCQSINQSIPLMEQQIPFPQITDKPQSHYLNSAKRCIDYAIETKEYQPAIKTLLLHLDNKQERLIQLFKTLLSQRDQWLRPLMHARLQEKAYFEHALSLIENHELERLRISLPSLLASQLAQISSELACLEHTEDSPRKVLKSFVAFANINQEIAKALAKTLLTSDNTWRKSFDHHVGLKKGICPDADYYRLKETSQKVLEELDQHPQFLDSLLMVSRLPKPQYDEALWEVLQALFQVLPLLAGHLHLSFCERNEVDFTAISQHALLALGDEENPTDLALYLDHAIHHLLVDEFQDTSITQFELLTQLVQGWQANDGKSLFIVGDPMQSIYRFRQAEVGLFFRAKEEGIGPVSLQSLQISCNFRSTKTIVDWVNLRFATIFPNQFDIESGAVCFHQSVNVLQDDGYSAVHALQCDNKRHEAQTLIECIDYELKTHPEQSIAVLVRSRSHLVEIIHQLRQAGIPYQGTDIDLLANLMHIRDAWSMTQALLSPGNRLSWLSLLRSPYCGLSLQDIHAIAQFNKKKSIYFALLHLEEIADLSEDGRTRARFFIHIMHEALTHRSQSRLSDWVGNTLKKLHLNHILDAKQLSDLEQFWNLLDRYEQDAHLPNLSEFLIELKALYAQFATPSRLQIMTIHKSKGLEFDTVFLPGLGAQPSRGDNPLLRWLKIPTQHDGNLLLVSPIQASHQEHCPLYDYLARLDEEKSHYESQRLLYVATTRAKSRLYLMHASTKKAKGSFLSLLSHQEFSLIEQEDATVDVSPKTTTTKLPLEFYQENLEHMHSITNPKPELTPSISRLIGIVTHKLLQWICEHHPEDYSAIEWRIVLHELQELGFDTATQKKALDSIQNQIIPIFSYPIGQWIIARHEQEHNEYPLLVNHQDTMATRIIDRTFEEDGVLWIIDFKTGKEDAESLIKHQKQLNEYGHYLSQRHSKPIQCGLYYLCNHHWVNWHYNTPHKHPSLDALLAEA